MKPPALVRELGLPLQPNGRIDVDRDDARAGPRERLGGRRLRGGPRPGRDYERPVPADLPSTPCARAGSRPRTSPPQLGHGKVKPFTYKTLGVFVDLGRNKAVANMLGLKLQRLPRLVGGAHLPPGDDAGAVGCGLRRHRLVLCADAGARLVALVTACWSRSAPGGEPLALA